MDLLLVPCNFKVGLLTWLRPELAVFRPPDQTKVWHPGCNVCSADDVWMFWQTGIKQFALFAETKSATIISRGWKTGWFGSWSWAGNEFECVCVYLHMMTFKSSQCLQCWHIEGKKKTSWLSKKCFRDVLADTHTKRWLECRFVFFMLEPPKMSCQLTPPLLPGSVHSMQVIFGITALFVHRENCLMAPLTLQRKSTLVPQNLVWSSAHSTGQFFLITNILFLGGRFYFCFSNKFRRQQCEYESHPMSCCKWRGKKTVNHD